MIIFSVECLENIRNVFPNSPAQLLQNTHGNGDAKYICGFFASYIYFLYKWVVNGGVGWGEGKRWFILLEFFHSKQVNSFVYLIYFVWYVSDGILYSIL